MCAQGFRAERVERAAGQRAGLDHAHDMGEIFLEIVGRVVNARCDFKHQRDA